jgi:hypothetical protein
VRFTTLIAAGLLLAVAPAAGAQTNQPPRTYRTTESRIGIGKTIHVPYDEEVQDAVVVIGGSLQIDGRVRSDVIVIGGNLNLGPQAEVRGDAVIVGGTINRADGARILGGINNVSIGEWGTWRIGDWYLPTIDFGDFGRWFALFGAVFRVAVLATLIALILVVARAPVARISQAAEAAPAKAFVAGLAAEICFIPALVVASIALAVTIIGIPLLVVFIPVTILAGCVAMLLGFTALTTRVGEWLEDRLGFRGHSAFLAAGIGLLLIVGPTLVSRFAGVGPWPIRTAGIGLLMIGITIEFIVWTIGLGATLMTGFGRWSTVPPPIPAFGGVSSSQLPVQS